MPGEHDASLGWHEAYRKLFDKTHHTFDHAGVHCDALDNVSGPRALIGNEQLQWLAVNTQGWIAVAVYVLVAIIRKYSQVCA